MAAKKKPKVSFENGMKELEVLVASMQNSDMALDELMENYEKGMELADKLEAVLLEHRRRIEQLDPETAEITTFEVNEHGLS